MVIEMPQEKLMFFYHGQGNLNTYEVLQRKLPFIFRVPSVFSLCWLSGDTINHIFSIASTLELVGTNYFLYLIFSGFPPTVFKKMSKICLLVL